MVFNKFYFRLLLNLILSCILGAFAFWSFTNADLLISRYILFLTWILSVFILFRFLYKTTHIIKNFTFKLKEDDYISLPESKNAFGKEFNNILRYLNNKIKTIKIEKEEQFHLFKTAVNQSGSGIIVFNSTGKIELINQAAQNIFKVINLENIHKLKESNPELPEKLRSEHEESFIISIQAKHELHKIAVHQNQFILRGKNLKVASFQNISAELDKEELEAWKKLMHVITHEIMNSVTPMKTLAYSLFEMFNKDQTAISVTELSEQDIDNTFLGLQAMNNRVQGLMHFVNSYRKLYKIPEPQFTHFNIHNILDETKILFKESFLEKKIKFEVKGNLQCSLFADKSLITQVLINLISNAIDAVQDQANPVIKIKIANPKNETIISVTDNGNGIKNEDLKDIFIPFFTTKKNGTGIGLYYSKMIIYMHKGELKVKSEYQKGSTFTIHL